MRFQLLANFFINLHWRIFESLKKLAASSRKTPFICTTLKLAKEDRQLQFQVMNFIHTFSMAYLIKGTAISYSYSRLNAVLQ